MKELTDAELVAAVLSGDVESFAGLFRRHRDTCTRFAVRMLGSHADADDVLQMAFLRAFRALGSCKEPSRFGGWLYQIVVNECRTFGSRRRKRDLRFVSDQDVIEQAIAPDDVYEGSGDFSERVEQALRLLPPDQREAFLLKHVEEKSYEEMAELTGVGVSALKMRVKRACETLRTTLAGVHHG
jgi:RNA polymerase sigma-70 factor (ECF subfamily)